MTVLEPTQQRPASWDAGSPRFPIDALRIDSVTKRFGEGPDSVLALDGISLRAGRGEFVCVVGAWRVRVPAHKPTARMTTPRPTPTLRIVRL